MSTGSRYFDVHVSELVPGDRLQLSVTVSARIVHTGLVGAVYWVTVVDYIYPFVIDADATVRVLRKVDLKR